MTRFLLVSLLFLSAMTRLDAHYFAVDRSENGQSAKVRFHMGTLVGNEDEVCATDLLFHSIYVGMPDNLKTGISLFQEEVGYFELSGETKRLLLFLNSFDSYGKKILGSGVGEATFLRAKKVYLEMLQKECDETEIEKIEALTYANMEASKHHFFTFLTSLPNLSKEISHEPQPVSHQETNLHLFHSLRLTASDCRNIDQLIHYLSMPWYKLMRHSGKANRLGDEVRPVHPLRFIGYVLSQPKLRKKLHHDIEGSSMVWSKFVHGFGDRMHHEKHHNNLYQYVPGFCQTLGVPTQMVNQYISSHEWELLLKELIHRHSH